MNQVSESLDDFAESSAQWLDWRWQLRSAARSPHELAQRGVISPGEASELKLLTERFKTLVTPYYLSLIDPDDAGCPIRRQAIPSAAELDLVSGERPDPIGDRAHSPTPLLVHRYPDRALLFPTYECPMFCRYCFRKEALNESPIRLHQELDASLAYLSAHPQIEEVILSGGDPLMISTKKLGELLRALSGIGVKRLRIHSRTPVTLPQRLDKALIELLNPRILGAPLTLVSHFNHSRELTALATEKLEALKHQGVTLLNQSVLLRGVNDRVETLRSLNIKLGEVGVIPYYLHHPDLTIGTQHLRVSVREGLRLFRALRGSMSGYLIPRYVVEIPGGRGKIELDSGAARSDAERGGWWLRSPLDGEEYFYRDLADSRVADPLVGPELTS